MIKQMLLSSLAGIFVTAMFLVAPSSAEAACQGFCADVLLINGCQYPYAGCAIYYDANDNPYNVVCYYSDPGCGGGGGGGGGGGDNPPPEI